MKRTIAISFFLLIFFLSVSGQWYTKSYGATDINSLTLDQLRESLKKSNTGILVSLGAIGVGGLIYLLERLAPYEVDQDSPFLEQLIGSKGMHNITMGLGIGLAVGGVIGTFAYLGRSAVIKRTIKRNFPGNSQLNISPALLFNSYTRGYSPGISFSVKF